MEKKILKDLSMSNASFKKPIGSFKKNGKKIIGIKSQITLVLKMVQAKYEPTHTLNFRDIECQKNLPKQNKTLLLKINFTMEKETMKEYNFQR